MKKVILSALTAMAIISLTSCSQYTCATYSKNITKKETNTRI